MLLFEIVEHDLSLKPSMLSIEQVSLRVFQLHLGTSGTCPTGHAPRNNPWEPYLEGLVLEAMMDGHDY